MCSFLYCTSYVFRRFMEPESSVHQSTILHIQLRAKLGWVVRGSVPLSKGGVSGTKPTRKFFGSIFPYFIYYCGPKNVCACARKCSRAHVHACTCRMCARVYIWKLYIKCLHKELLMEASLNFNI